MLCTPIVYISIQIIFTQKALGKVARASCMHFVSRDFFTVRDHQINKHGGAERAPKTEENGPFKRKRKEEKEKRTDKNGQFNKNISRICLRGIRSSCFKDGVSFTRKSKSLRVISNCKTSDTRLCINVGLTLNQR